jgi:hypothetical protein
MCNKITTLAGQGSTGYIVVLSNIAGAVAFIERLLRRPAPKAGETTGTIAAHSTV